MKDFTNIVDESKQLPLDIDLALLAEGEMIQALVNSDVGKDRLNNSEASGIDPPSRDRVDLMFHGIDQARMETFQFDRERAVPCIRLGQTAGSQ